MGWIASVIQYLNLGHSGESQKIKHQHRGPWPGAGPQCDWGFGMTNVSCLLVSLLAVSLFSMGCVNSNKSKFQHKISRMSDAELLCYYHGVNDRLKDLAHDLEMHESAHHLRVTDQHYIYQTPFAAGGEGYHLIRNRNFILEELHERNIHPILQ